MQEGDDAGQRRDRERERDLERRRQRQPDRVPADNVYALLARISRRDSVAARGSTELCALCGRRLTPETLTVDHVVARALGGPDIPDNLQATCPRCNNLKSRLESAVVAKRERGIVLDGVAAAVLAAIPNKAERDRFAAHSSVRGLLEELTEPEQPPDG